MRCNLGHDHSQQEVVAATRTPSHPRGKRPYHCPVCSLVNPHNRKPNHWRRYATAQAAIASGQHPRGCSFCFPQ